MSSANILYAQSGGSTAVINATACGVIQAAAQHEEIGSVYAAHNGILGILNEKLINASQIPAEDIAALKHTPACAFGTCRYKLKNMEEDDSEYRRLIDVFDAHNIRYFFYNGGGDSQDTAYKISHMSQQLNYPLTVIGLPKTIDNDLPFTDSCPGFGSVAKYVAISTQEAAHDLKSMHATSTKIFVLEVMGRHTGWIAASANLLQDTKNCPPLMTLLPEVPFQKEAFLQTVQQRVDHAGYCVIVTSEGIRDQTGEFLSAAGLTDAFGHKQLGGVAPILCHLIKSQLGHKYHWGIADYLQRSARHIASQTDLDQAYALGQAAVTKALNGTNNVMLTIQRLNDSPYQWEIGCASLSDVANQERGVPSHFIQKDGFGVTEECLQYLRPLIQGEAYPPYNHGLPHYVAIQNQQVATKLKEFA